MSSDAASRETIADIVADMRKRCTPYAKSDNADCRYVAYLGYREFADRLEAAWNHERESWETAACSFVSVAVMSGKVAVEHKHVYNESDLRMALVRIVEIAKSWADPGADAAVTLGLIIDKAESALSKPPRNCDVGTEFEQVGRFKEFCHAHFCDHCPCRVDDIDPSHYETDPCPVIWAQLQYTDEGGAS